MQNKGSALLELIVLLQLVQMVCKVNVLALLIRDCFAVIVELNELEGVLGVQFLHQHHAESLEQLSQVEEEVAEWQLYL